MSTSILSSPRDRKLLIRRNNDLIFIIIFLFLLMAASAILDGKFLRPNNLNNLLKVWAPVIIATYAQSMILIGMAGVDLSIAGTVALVNCLCSRLMTDSPVFGWLGPIVLCLVIGAVIGVGNGLLVTKGRQQPIIMTLATNTFLTGVALFVRPEPGGFVHRGFSRFLMRGWGGLVPLVIVVAVTVVFWLILNRTSFGRSCYAVGGNESAALATGISTDRVKILCFVMSGVLSAIAGVMITALMSSGDSHCADQYATRTITAAVVGGVSLMGGKGNILGGIAGVFILAIINNILNLVGISSYYQYVFQGSILILALAFAVIRNKR